MKRVLFVGVAFVAFAAGSVMAADITAVPEPAPAPVYSKTRTLMQFYDWTGFYLGGRVDYSRVQTGSTTINTATGALDASLSGSSSNFHGGGQAGFDYMMPSRVVIGVAADVATGDDVITTISNAAGTNVHTEESKTATSGTVRARLGYALGSVLAYGTGGWAWTYATATRAQVVGKSGNATAGVIESGPANLNGWTAGAGLAYGFWRNWEVFGEYRYTSFQSNTAVYPFAQRSTTSATTANSIVAGLNFKFDPFMTRY